jgi:small-conductance mechanosensitive channel
VTAEALGEVCGQVAIISAWLVAGVMTVRVVNRYSPVSLHVTTRNGLSLLALVNRCLLAVIYVAAMGAMFLQGWDSWVVFLWPTVISVSVIIAYRLWATRHEEAEQRRRGIPIEETVTYRHRLSKTSHVTGPLGFNFFHRDHSLCNRYSHDVVTLTRTLHSAPREPEDA